MASLTQQNLSLYGVFYLPLAVLTGLSLSAILPAALSFVIPAMKFVLFTSLPHLWNAFLSWVTPPCLFVLLNGIIVVLTASSGVLSSSETDDGLDFSAHLLTQKKNLLKASPRSLSADDSVSTTLVEKKDMPVQSSEAAMVECYLSESSHPDDDAQTDVEMVHSRNPMSTQTMLDADESSEHRNILTEDDDDLPTSLAMVSRSLDSLIPLHVDSWEEEEEKEEEKEEEEEEEEEGGEQEKNEKISALPKLDVVHKTGFPSGYRSEPSSPQFVTVGKGNPIQRSLSIDSASFQGEPSTSSPENLSDEAFRKRVEAFISKMNAQMRSEAK